MRPTRSGVLSLGAGALLLGLGALTGRPEVALLGAGPVLVWGRALLARPSGEVSVEEELEVERNGAMRADHLAATYRLCAPGAAQLRVRVTRSGARTAEAVLALDDDGTRSLPVTTSSFRSGAQPLFGVEHLALGPAGALTAEPGRREPTRVVALPSVRRLRTVPLPFRLRGLTGAHPSRRPGDGGELRDVHVFQPGDRLRRIDWRVTARRSPRLEEIYVRRDYALADSLVVVVLDSRDDVGPDPATWSGAVPVRPGERTSLDIAREAAASLAGALVESGDRVALRDLADARRPLEAGTGRRHLERLLWQLATTAPRGAAPERVRAPQVPSGALVVLLSTFLDPHAAAVAARWRRSGHRVLAIDTLPPLRTDGLSSRERLALRLVRIERADRLAELEAVGVETFAWQPAPGQDGPEVHLARMSHRRHGQPVKEVGL